MRSAKGGDGERYELLGELATGGMATVYLGRMRRPMGFARLVAIKAMHPQYAKDPSFASMFVDEARLTARLRHPNIVPTLDIVADGGHLLIVMEYVEGESLAAILRLVRDASDRMPVAVACAVIHDLLLGLHEAHEARDDDGSPLAIIHRDVSPQNVIVGLDGLARVLDFGVAKARSRVHHSNEGEIKGKIPYMPPEQLFGEAVDHRVDIYAAGVLLWESLAGQRLFDGSNEESIVRRIDAGEIAAPSSKVAGVSPELDALVLRALSKNADDRFPTALAMAEALSAIVTLPPRTEISAWMKRFARPRSIPADAIGTSIDLASESVSPDELVAVLERATVASRPSFAPVSTSAPRTAPARTSRLAMVLGVVSFALAGVLVGRAMRAETAHAETAHHAAAPSPALAAEQPDVAVAPLAPASEAPTPAPAPAPKLPARKVAKSPSPIATAAKPVVEAPAPSLATPEAKPASCRLPYVVDAEGHRHYKVECL
ncbi:MAG TPA: serine/threonine-protein kinase [Labilithrix sp.]|nr:serine/threonine-protein kinase [Labilithrix sp.]